MKLNILTLRGLFSYKGEGRVGDVVEVPLRNKRGIGVVWSVDEKDEGNLQEAKNLNINIPKDVLELVEFASSYYFSPLGAFIPLIIPPSYYTLSKTYYVRISDKPPKTKLLELWEYLEKPRTLKSIKRRFGKDLSYHLRKWEKEGYVKKFEKMVLPRLRKPEIYDFGEYELPKKITKDKERVLNMIYNAINVGNFKAFLLKGPTGSGKTLVYLKGIEKVLEKGKSSLILVPEIFLSYHLARVFQEVFGDAFALYHSGMPKGDRLAVWMGVLKGNIKVVMGTRRAIFLPFKDLGMIMVDEEFEESYKEEERVPMFNARDMAVYRAKILKIPVILGSATPSLESLHNVKKRKYVLLEISNEYWRKPKLDIRIVDMRKEKKLKGVFSETFIEELKKSLDEGKNAIIYINRRGYKPYFFCKDCGKPVKCKSCDVVMALHKGKYEEFLKCHICGNSQSKPLQCEYCKGTNLIGAGIGTQKVEELLKEFVGVNIVRMDSDVVRRRKEVIEILKKFKDGDIRILVGTKMVIKGLDFKNVGFVGVINADDFIYYTGDFRSEEKALQTLVQVIGRLRTGGKAIIQTYNPEHRVIRSLIKGDVDKTMKDIYLERGKLGFPPFRRMAFFEVWTHNEHNRDINFKLLEDFVKKYRGDAVIWGPSYPPISKLRDFYRVRVILLSDNYWKFHTVFNALNSLGLRGRKIVNVDPINML